MLVASLSASTHPTTRAQPHTCSFLHRQSKGKAGNIVKMGDRNRNPMGLPNTPMAVQAWVSTGRANLPCHAHRAKTAERLNAEQPPRQTPGTMYNRPHCITTAHVALDDAGLLRMQVLSIPTLLTLCRVAAIPVTMAGASCHGHPSFCCACAQACLVGCLC